MIRGASVAAVLLALFVACTAAQQRDAQSAVDGAESVCVNTKPTGQAERLICLSIAELDRALPQLEAWRAQQSSPSSSARGASSLGGGSTLDAGPDGRAVEGGAP